MRRERRALAAPFEEPPASGCGHTTTSTAASFPRQREVLRHTSATPARKLSRRPLQDILHPDEW